MEAALELAKPSPSYVRHARLAMAGLIGFLVFYLGLTAFFIASAVRLLPLGWHADSDLPALAWGIADVLLALFMLRGLWFIKRAAAPRALEITASDEPQLFAFLEQLVVRAGAPRPHRVYLSHDVNAAVFYDFSLINLIWPTRKNLLIGLGLVNGLSLGELEAVLAHEFGHFAQRSMAVGRWVYMAQQIAGQVVARRGLLDEVLRGISNIDLRVAWIGWLLRLIVWSLRSTIDIVLRGVVVAERALSREMEFQADAVAVALTGSDALVHALHRLGAAEEAMGEAMQIAVEQLHEGRAVPDLYELQTQAMARMALILGDPSYGCTPPRPNGDPAQHRVFEHERAQPPKMWSTHPSNRAREDHAKAHYVARPIDERPAWVLFREPLATRRAVTRRTFEELGVEFEKVQGLADHEAHALVEHRYGRHYLDPRYRGAYLGRSCVREAKQVSELFDAAPPPGHDFALLYPPTLRDDLSRWKDVMLERTLLEGLRDGRLTTPDGVIRHRGQPIRPREIPSVLTTLDDECSEARRRLAAHDRACRTLHAAAARWLGEDWAHYHYAMVALLHYADHSEANLRDAQRHLENVLEVVTADDRVTDDERYRVVESASDMHFVLRDIYKQIDMVVLPEPVARQLGKPWAAMLEQRYTNPPPSAESLGEWLPAVATWFDATASALDKLERACLQHLLELEALLESCVRERRHPGPPPAPARCPNEYRVLPPGSERKRQTKLDLWDRFYLAQGWGPAILRTAAALTIVVGVLYGSYVTGR